MAVISPNSPLPWMIDFHSNEDKDTFNQQYGAACAKGHLEYLSKLSIKSTPNIFRCTQFITIITPKTLVETVVNLLKEGLTVAVIRTDTVDKARSLIRKVNALVRKYSKKIGRSYCLSLGIEIKGPEIRIGKLKGKNTKRIFLEMEEITQLTTLDAHKEFVTKSMIYVDYEKLWEVVRADDYIYLDKASVILKVLYTKENLITCLVTKPGPLVSFVTVTIPNVFTDQQKLTEKDLEFINMTSEESVDYIFVCEAENKKSILNIKNLVEYTHVVAKIQNSLAVENIDEIIKVSDAIYIDCDKLLIGIQKEKLFLIEKSIIAKCNLAGKPVLITASIQDMRCLSKAEIFDLCDVVVGGCDGIVLPHDLNSPSLLKTISAICKEAEPAVHQVQVIKELATQYPCPTTKIYALGISIVAAAFSCKAGVIICFSYSGKIPKVISRFRPTCPIIAVTYYPKVARLSSMYSGVEGLVIPKCGNVVTDTERGIRYGIAYAKNNGYVRVGNAIVIAIPEKLGFEMTNTLKIIYLGAFDRIPVDNTYDDIPIAPLCEIEK